MGRSTGHLVSPKTKAKATWGGGGEHDPAALPRHTLAAASSQAHELDPLTMGALLARLKEEEEIELEVDMHRFTHTFRDPALERHYLKFYARSASLKMRRSLMAAAVGLLVASLRNHVVNPDQPAILLPLDGALLSAVATLVVLYRWTHFGQFLSLDAVMCCGLLSGTTLATLALWFHLLREKELCDGDDDCLKGVDYPYGIMIALTFSALGLLLTAAVRKFVHLLVLLSWLVVLFVALFLVAEGEGTRYLPYTLLLMVSVVLLAMARSHDLVVRRAYLLHVDTVQLTKVHLRKLEEARNRKEKVVGYLFHEVRNPINDIVLATSLALDNSSEQALNNNNNNNNNSAKGDGNGPSDQDSAFSTPSLLRVISDSAGAASRVLDDALDLQKLEAGNFAFVHAPFRLGAAYVPVVDATRSRFAAKSVKLEVDDSDLAGLAVVGDLRRLRQVVHNFLSNALKFSSPGGRVRVDVRRQRRLGTQCEVRLEVSDEGIGIHPSDRGKIFTPYSQVRAAETQGGGGTGLGLALSKDFVERGHNGHIGFKSPGSLGRGTTFYFVISFPLSPQDISPPPALLPVDGEQVETPSGIGSVDGDQAGSEPHQSPQQPGAQEKGAQEATDVLLVDDSAITRKLVGRMLSGLGVTFAECANGEEAVQLARQHAFRLVLMDKEMPVMDGFQATKLIRDFNPTVPIVGVTGNAMDNQRQDFIDCGATEVVSKPIGKDGVIAVLERYHVLPNPS